jgi:hypothetical protein
MRFVAPAREAVDPAVFAQPPLSLWSEFQHLLGGADWPDVAALNRVADNAALSACPRFVAQTPDLLRDGLHYELRIAERAEIATRERNWHDLLNALIWLRFPALKAALNARQVAEIARVGAKQRSRAQQALTHFDEAGVIAIVRDPELLESWDAHDWHGLFSAERAAWNDGRIEAIVFGHALLEHALKPGQLLVGKALVVDVSRNGNVEDAAVQQVAESIRRGQSLNDPQELRPLPLSGIPGWHRDNAAPNFFSTAPCFRPLRAGRRYPPALRDRSADAVTSPWPSPPTR